MAKNSTVQIDLGPGQFDLYDAVSNRFLAHNVSGQSTFSIASDQAIQLVLAPARGVATRNGRRLLVDGIVIDYNATLLSNNLIRNPYVDSASPSNSTRPAFWHYSSNAQWSADTALSPSHSLQLVDTASTDAEEWRSYATQIPAGEGRKLQVRWFWNYDIAPGEEFQGRLRLSPNTVVGLDLINPSLEFNFVASGMSDGFEMFETVITIPDNFQSFDLTFITGGALSALGTIFIDDISIAIAPDPKPGDFDGDGDVDSQDLLVWESAFGQTSVGDADGDRDSDGRDFLIWQRYLLVQSSPAASVPEPASTVLALFSVDFQSSWSQASTLIKRILKRPIGRSIA